MLSIAPPGRGEWQHAVNESMTVPLVADGRAPLRLRLLVDGDAVMLIGVFNLAFADGCRPS